MSDAEQMETNVSQTKRFRKELDEVLQELKNAGRKGRERSLSVTKIQEAIMWLGMDLKEQNNEGMAGCDNPYPESYNPASQAIEPTADGLKL